MIRDARLGERLALEALQRRSSDVWPRYREALTANPGNVRVPRAAIADGRVRVAADVEGRLLGFALFCPPSADGGVELDGLFVEPDAMRAGVGRALVEDAAACAAAAGGRSLDVVAGPEVVDFYERLGFVREGEAESLYAEAFRLHRALGRAAAAPGR